MAVYFGADLDCAVNIGASDIISLDENQSNCVRFDAIKWRNVDTEGTDGLGFIDNGETFLEGLTDR